MSDQAEARGWGHRNSRTLQGRTPLGAHAQIFFCRSVETCELLGPITDIAFPACERRKPRVYFFGHSGPLADVFGPEDALHG